MVVCGNRLERVSPGDGGPAADVPTSPYSTYAGGADGALLRCLVKKAAGEGWGLASLDVTTAFLLAPRRESERQLLVMKPPKVLVDAGVCNSEELWQIQHAMYGLTSSPSDWGHYRNSVLSRLQWNFEGAGYQLIQTPEPNLGEAVLSGSGASLWLCGHLCGRRPGSWRGRRHDWVSG